MRLSRTTLLLAVSAAVVLASVEHANRSRRRELLPTGIDDVAKSPVPAGGDDDDDDDVMIERVTRGAYTANAPQSVADLTLTPLTPDTAPSGLSIRRSFWLAPALLLVYAVIAALIEPEFGRITYLYGRWVRDAAFDPNLVLPKQSSVAIRPLFVALLIVFAIFAAGTPGQRVKLLLRSLALYIPATFVLDTVLARLSTHGGPSPFMAAGNVLAGVLAVAVAAVCIFTSALLPGDVRVHRRLPRRYRPIVLLLLSLGLTVLSVGELRDRYSSVIGTYEHYPMLGGIGSRVVLFVAILPMMMCVVGALSALFRRRRKGDWPSIAFIVPARNEQGLIGDCVNSLALAAAGYPGRVTAYVIENGSSDETAVEARAALAAGSCMDGVLLQCPPLGKSHALNVGLQHATADIIVRVDADTQVDPHILTRLAPHFWREDVGGVGVLPLPRQRHGWIAHMRAVETYYGVAFKRVAQNVADCITVLPGATVAYRRDVLVELDGFAEGINGEDADITVRVGRLGYRIVSDWRARTYTDVPRTYAQLREQRMRWSRGLYHMVGRNRSAIWMRQGVRGMWMIPWATFVMFRKLMLIPFAVAVVAMIAVNPSSTPLREVAAAGAILLGVQLFQMAAVLIAFRRLDLVAVLPSYLIFRLIVTYFALETLLTLSLAGSGRQAAQRHRPRVPLGSHVARWRREAVNA